MLSKNDIQVLRAMFVENNAVLQKSLRKEWREDIEANNHVLKREIRDEMHSVVHAEVSASERRLTAVIEDVRKDVHTLRDEILDLVNEEILPQIDQCQRDIVQLKIVTNIA